MIPHDTPENPHMICPTTPEAAAELARLRAEAAKYRHRRDVAFANGFGSLTEAIAEAARVPALVDALCDLLRALGDRTAQNCLGGLGSACDKARAALAQPKARR